MTIINPVFHHVTFKTTRLDEMIAWYAVVIGGTVNYKDPVNAWMTNDEANHRVAFLAVPGLSDDPQKDSHNGAHHSAFEYASFADLITSFKRLREEGIRPAFCLEHGLTISIYYKDPEGNFVELQSDNFGDWKLSSEWMRTSPEFAANPIGFFFDADKVADLFDAGATPAAIRMSIRANELAPPVIPAMGLPAPEPSIIQR